MKINIHLGCSQKAMETMPANKYGLAIVDPPYGIGEASGGEKSRNNSPGRAKTKVKYKIKTWDKNAPDELYFNELVRVNKNQIIWGANHFLGWASSCWLVWDKDNSGDFADCELAYTSFDSSVRKFKYRWNGMLQEDMKNKEQRIHPTQKPVALYKWLLKNYGFNKDGSKRTIFDSHGGSMSIVIACIDMGFDIDIWEIDDDYYNDAVKRIKRHLQQLDLTREPVEFLEAERNKTNNLRLKS